MNKYSQVLLAIDGQQFLVWESDMVAFKKTRTEIYHKLLLNLMMGLTLVIGQHQQISAIGLC